MIIDPSRDGCTIWYQNKVQFIKGNPKECIERIFKFITLVDDEGKRRQCIYNIILDTAGIGISYADLFEEYNIDYTRVRPKNIL